MAEDWAIDVKKYVPDADDAVIAAIVRHCGIALRNRDSSLVSFTDPAETDRVREGYCRKKLGLTDPDPVIDAAIARVGERMSGDTTRNRVTVYYLLAEAFGKLGLFGAVETTPVAVVAPVVAAAPIVAAAPAAAAAATIVAAAAIPAQAASVQEDRRGPEGGIMLIGCGVLGAIILGGAAIATMLDTRKEPVPVVSAPTYTAAVAAPVIPDGAGVVSQQVEGKPLVSVYFDTAKTDISPDFAAVTAPVKVWIISHPGARLAVSGFNDPRGDAAFNAELSKNRAKAVAAALATTGVPADVIDLEKPPETTDSVDSLAEARRVDIRIKDAI